MSLPPGFLEELRSRTSLSSVVGRKVMWDMRKSNQAKGDMWAPCPFHQEKTASFHVDDRKGFYHCFGCHASGDAISFLRETENVGFMEAVEILAQDVGMTMPARDPKAQEKADQRSALVEVMEQAVRFYRLQLQTGAAAEARAYLTKRGLGEAALAHWEIGYAPNGWQALWDHLKGKDVPDQMILDAGLAKPSSTGKKPYDTFRDRIIFPIRDARGRAIAFGGRAMDPQDKAKYLNSPETLLFDKGASLFNHGPARTAAGKDQPLVVAEGYMDVIALAEHGFEASVAPLGTAITERQLQMLWRISPEPIVALDGDTAGLRAAMRLIDLALPMLEAGKSLRFALMPDGQDPDDLLRAQGPEALRALLDQAVPMVQLLWRRETEGRDFDSPERRAALDKALRETCAKIEDVSIRSHYQQALKDLRWQLFRRAPVASGQRRSRVEAVRPTTKRSASLLEDTEHLREQVILAVLVTSPDLIDEFETGIEMMRCDDPFHRELRRFLLRKADLSPVALREAIDLAFGPEALEKLLRQGHVAVVPCIRAPGNRAQAAMTLTEQLGRLKSELGWVAEVEEAAQDNMGEADEGLTWRLSEAAKNRENSRRIAREETEETVVAENGARISRDEQNALDALLQRIHGEKPQG